MKPYMPFLFLLLALLLNCQQLLCENTPPASGKARNHFTLNRKHSNGIIASGKARSFKNFVEKNKFYLSDADLKNADLQEADLRGADLRAADLAGANLTGANLQGADLRGAELEGANLFNADLSGADLYGTEIGKANLHGANLQEARMPTSSDTLNDLPQLLGDKQEKSEAPEAVPKLEENDVKGWNGLRYGMSEEQILKILQGHVKPMAEPYEDEWWHADLWMEKISAGNFQYEVYFLMRKKTNKLGQIMIYPKEKKGSTANFEFLEKALAQRYGEPNERKEGGEGNAAELTRAWKFPSSKIELKCTNPDSEDGFMYLRYYPNQAGKRKITKQ